MSSRISTAVKKRISPTNLVIDRQRELVIDRPAGLAKFLSSIPPSSTLYLDLKRSNLEEMGCVSLLTVYIQPQDVIQLIDIQQLKKLAFTTPSDSDGKTLKDILGDPNIPKCFWGAANAARWLWASYEVKLAGVMDMKCLETVARANDETYVAEDGWRTPFNLRYGCKEFWEWEDTKYEWEHRHDPFYYRPVPFRSLLYCVNDVYHLPELHAVYLAHLSEEFIADARERSVRRVKQGPDEPTSSSETETEGGDDAPEGDAMECAEG